MESNIEVGATAPVMEVKYSEAEEAIAFIGDKRTTTAVNANLVKNFSNFVFMLVYATILKILCQEEQIL